MPRRHPRMDGQSSNKRLLFVHADSNGSTTHLRSRSKLLDSNVRRHLMADIGKSRRKPPQAPSFDTLVWSLEEPPEFQPSTDSGERSTSGGASDHPRACAKELAMPATTPQHSATYISASPILHALSVFEKQWGEDMFSAYGFALIMSAGKAAMRPGSSTSSFWFPFAFRKSAFLRHYKHIFVSPDIMIPLYRRSAKELRSLALERSLETIQCVESRLSSSDADVATSDAVLQAVMAMTCYNFTTLDFAQALIHVRGLGMVLAARGGIDALVADQDLLRMISWVDVTAALLSDTKPLFRLPALTPRVSISDVRGLEHIPVPLLTLMSGEEPHDAHLMSVMSSIGDLDALAAHLRFEYAAKGSAIWEDEDRMASLMNPVTHQLLCHSLASDPVSYCEYISEALRLGALIWIISIKRRCRSYPGTAGPKISNLLKILSRRSIMANIWARPDLRIVRLWLLVLCSISEAGVQDLASSMRMILDEMEEATLGSWADTMADIRRMPWVDIFELPCAQLGERLVEQIEQSKKIDRHIS